MTFGWLDVPAVRLEHVHAPSDPDPRSHCNTCITHENCPVGKLPQYLATGLFALIFAGFGFPFPGKQFYRRSVGRRRDVLLR